MNYSCTRTYLATTAAAAAAAYARVKYHPKHLGKHRAMPLTGAAVLLYSYETWLGRQLLSDQGGATSKFTPSLF